MVLPFLSFGGSRASSISLWNALIAGSTSSSSAASPPAAPDAFPGGGLSGTWASPAAPPSRAARASRPSLSLAAYWSIIRWPYASSKRFLFFVSFFTRSASPEISASLSCASRMSQSSFVIFCVSRLSLARRSCLRHASRFFQSS